MKILITGAAGLVGQNLVLLMREQGYTNLVAIDKQSANLKLLGELNPGVRVVDADLAAPGAWEAEFTGADTVVVLHAQITGKTSDPFVRNNIEASKLVYEAIRKAGVPYTVQISSSVVNSVADDDYTNTKKAQEKLFLATGLPGCVLRPTLMYGWFDPKHFGWLARFMEKAPVFPIPGHGRYMRQPLYNRDFCRAILWCLEHRPVGAIYDLVGNERIDYIDIIREIKRVKGLSTPIVHRHHPRDQARQGPEHPHREAALLVLRRPAARLCAGLRQTSVHVEPAQGIDRGRRFLGRGHQGHLRLRPDARAARFGRNLPSSGVFQVRGRAGRLKCMH